jgi:two-component sensor histidine kinase
MGAPVILSMPELTLPGVPESVRQFRALAREVSSTSGQAAAAALCVSELVTNSLLHSRSGLPGGQVTVTIDTDPISGTIRISVMDGGPRASDSPANGYGLRVIAAVAMAWGVLPARSGRACTWCEIGRAA